MLPHWWLSNHETMCHVLLCIFRNNNVKKIKVHLPPCLVRVPSRFSHPAVTHLSLQQHHTASATNTQTAATYESSQIRCVRTYLFDKWMLLYINASRCADRQLSHDRLLLASFYDLEGWRDTVWCFELMKAPDWLLVILKHLSNRHKDTNRLLIFNLYITEVSFNLLYHATASHKKKENHIVQFRRARRAIHWPIPQCSVLCHQQLTNPAEPRGVYPNVLSALWVS